MLEHAKAIDRADEIAAYWMRPGWRREFAEQLREYAKEAVEAERERCAKIALKHPYMYHSGLDVREAIAAQIREGKK